MSKAHLEGPVAVSLGDPAGIGPELIAEAWARRVEENLPSFFVLGGARSLTAAAKSRGLDVPVEVIQDVSEAEQCFRTALPVIGADEHGYYPGQPDEAGAKLAFSSLKDAARLVSQGLVSALVTGPIAKSRLAQVGFTHPGQTEFIAEYCGVPGSDAVMMLAGPSLRTVPLTVHVALADVPKLVTHNLIVLKTRTVARALAQDFGILSPRIAIAALNPHAGEDGLFGDEDIRIVAPAIAALRSEGINASGPYPADALFALHTRSTFDVALCMYHDQALIPIKTLDFDQGVNVTLGLPIIRTSPDHGTAFGIAGKNIANPGAMIAAIRMAGECALRRAAS